MNPRQILSGFLIILLLAACAPAATPAEPTPDVAAVRTSAASTVVSEFTLTAAAFTATVAPSADASATEPVVDATASPTTAAVAQVTNAEGTVVALCDKYSWDPETVDVNIPDNTTMSPGQEFIKTWKIKNIGTCTWGEGYEMVFSYSSSPTDDALEGVAQPLTAAIGPQQEVEVSVQFTAPDLPGTYFSVWTMQNVAGVPFQGNDNKALYVQVVVQ
ncbi:MAG TPA: NBR1-Ig-like domain-containing protein [Anaerolineales bacterium]|nr:NBR1-Ig-like domain-containing protein [Anaerolineales bacterium]